MDKNGSQGSQSPSVDDHDRPSKRQKLDTTDSSPTTSPNSKYYFTQFKALRRKLNQTESTAVQNHRIRIKTEEMFEKEKNILQTQAQLNKEKMILLRGDLTRSMEDGKNARRAKESAKAILSRLKIVVDQQIRPLMMDSDTEGIPPVTQVQEMSTEGEEKPKPSEENIIDMEKTLEDGSISQEELQAENVQLKEVDKERKVLEARAERADKLEEELRVAGDTISSLHAALKKKELSIKEKFDEAERLEHQLMILRSQSASDAEGSSLTPADNCSSSGCEVSTGESSCFDGQSGVDEESVISESGGEQKDVGILVGTKYCLLAWRPQFVEMQWDKELTHKDKLTWMCSSCSCGFPSKERAQDHVWIVHYKGKFGCSYCTDDPGSYTWRRSLVAHIKNKHNDL